MRLILCMSAVLALTACGTAEQPTPQVASLQTAGSGATSAAPPSSEQPRERIDDTPEQAAARSKPYRDCMKSNGVPFGKAEAAAMSDEEYERVQPAAWAKCKHLFPLRAWEFDKTNPESMDFIHRVVQCMRAAGAKVEEKPAGPGVDFNGYGFVGENPQFAEGKGMELSSRCEKESLRR